MANRKAAAKTKREEEDEPPRRYVNDPASEKNYQKQSERVNPNNVYSQAQPGDGYSSTSKGKAYIETPADQTPTNRTPARTGPTRKVDDEDGQSWNKRDDARSEKSTQKQVDRVSKPNVAQPQSKATDAYTSTSKGRDYLDTPEQVPAKRTPSRSGPTRKTEEDEDDQRWNKREKSYDYGDRVNPSYDKAERPPTNTSAGTPKNTAFTDNSGGQQPARKNQPRQGVGRNREEEEEDERETGLRKSENETSNRRTSDRTDAIRRQEEEDQAQRLKKYGSTKASPEQNVNVNRAVYEGSTPSQKTPARTESTKKREDEQEQRMKKNEPDQRYQERGDQRNRPDEPSQSSRNRDFVEKTDNQMPNRKSSDRTDVTRKQDEQDQAQRLKSDKRSEDRGDQRNRDQPQGKQEAQVANRKAPAARTDVNEQEKRIPRSEVDRQTQKYDDRDVSSEKQPQTPPTKTSAVTAKSKPVSEKPGAQIVTRKASPPTESKKRGEEEQQQVSRKSGNQESKERGYSGSQPVDQSQSRTKAQNKSEAKIAAREKSSRTRQKKMDEKKELLKKYETTLKPALDGFEVCLRVLKSKMDKTYFGTVEQTLASKLNDVYWTYKEQEHRCFLGDKLAGSKLVEALVDYYIYVLEDLDIKAVTVGLEKKAKFSSGIKLIFTIREILNNYSDASLEFGAAICETQLLRCLMSDLREIHRDGLTKLMYDDVAFKSAMSIIRNCARSQAPRKHFREVHAVDHLLPFSSSDSDQLIKLMTLMALAHILDEDENRYLEADSSVLDMLLTMIKDALKQKDHSSHGFSVYELVDGLTGLATADNNKKPIMDKGAQPILEEVLGSPSEREQVAAVRALRELAFREENKEKLLRDSTLLEGLTRRTTSENEDLAESVRGIYFLLRGKSKIFEEEELPVEEEKKPHIMMSYQWANQELVLYIRDRLTALGYEVWLDVDNMSGSILDVMAEAIEEASVVLMCMSEKYKLSQNCRTEAEYAYKLKKHVVPLLMEFGYKPNGWLGLILGSKYFVDFSGKYEFEAKFDDLVKQLGDMGRASETTQSLTGTYGRSGTSYRE